MIMKSDPFQLNILKQLKKSAFSAEPFMENLTHNFELDDNCLNRLSSNYKITTKNGDLPICGASIK